MVVQETTEKGGVGEVAIYRRNHTDELIEALSSAIESANKRVIDRIVERVDRGILLVTSNVWSIAEENLTLVEDAGSVDEIRPETLTDVLDGVNANGINSVIGNKLFNPVVPIRNNSVAFSVQVGQSDRVVTKPALLNVGLVVVISDPAEGMVVIRSTERTISFGRLESRTRGGGDVVNDDVDLEIHSPVVQRRTQRLELISGPKVGVERLGIKGPVTVIRLAFAGSTANVFDNGRYPDSVKAHSLNVVELLSQSGPCSTTVLAVSDITIAG